jgi:hypothetical protein
MANKLQRKFFLWAVLAAACIAGPLSHFAKAGNQDAKLDGKWHFVLDTEGGTREVDANLQLDGTKVTGTWGTADVKGTFSDGNLSLEFSYNSDEVGPGTMKIDGKLSGDQMTGNWSFQTYDGTFKATRTKAATS